MKRYLALLATLCFLMTDFAFAAPMGTGFTYQGELEMSGSAANGDFDMQFELFDAEMGGVSQAPPVGPFNVSVSGGIFSVELDFGLEPFDGTQLWLEITVDGMILSPRQKLTASPYAITALSSAYDRVAIVSPGGANYTSPLEAMQNLAAWCGAPLIAQKCLVYVLPGTYVHASPVELQFNVDLIGVDAENVTLVHSDTAGEGVLNPDACGTDGCYIANLTLYSESTTPLINTSGGIVGDNGGAIRGRHIHIDINGHPSNGETQIAIENDGDVDIDDLVVNWSARANNEVIGVTNGSALKLSRCSVTATALVNNQTVSLIIAFDTSVTMAFCDLRVNNGLDSGNGTAVRVTDGTLHDTHSTMFVDLGQSGSGIVVNRCPLGPARLDGTHVVVEAGTGAAQPAGFTECDLAIEDAHLEGVGVSGAGLTVVQSNVDVERSVIIGPGNAFQLGIVTAVPTYQITVSNSLLKAPGTLIESNAEITSSVMFSRLEDGGLGTGVNCAYNIDETLADVVCP